MSILFTSSHWIKHKELLKILKVRSFDFQSTENLGPGVMFGPFPMNAAALVNHIKPRDLEEKLAAKNTSNNNHHHHVGYEQMFWVTGIKDRVKNLLMFM